MDIMRPPLEQQVSPVPGLVARSNVDVPALVGRVLTQQPNASSDDVVRQLSAWGVQVSGIIVSMRVLKLREQAAEARCSNGEKPSPTAPAIPSLVLAASRDRLLGGTSIAAVFG